MIRGRSSILGLCLAILALFAVQAVALERQPRLGGEVVMQVGDTVHLFHSGTADVKKIFCVNDVLPVYRDIMAGGSTRSKQVGTVQILSYVGDNYLEAKILEGNIERGDVAKKESAACIVHPVRTE